MNVGNIYTKKDNCYDHWHRITKTHVNTFTIDDDIEYKFNDMDLQRYLYKC